MPVNKTNQVDVSIVLGSKNRKNLIKATIDSIRNNGFKGNLEIIVIDGGSNDGTCNWLAQQKDIFTFVQPNYKIIDTDGTSMLAYSWGEFMNIAFKHARGKWIVMVSDDLLLEKNCLQKGYDFLTNQEREGIKVGGGAFFFREYPRNDYFRVINLPGNVVNINHGFYSKKALEDINYLDEKTYNFYCADGDVSLRLEDNGWKIFPLQDCFAEHLVHLPKFNRKNIVSKITQRDLNRFNEKYSSKTPVTKHFHIGGKPKYNINVTVFWRAAFFNCFFGYLLRFYDTKISKEI